ncbi:MAG: hypothetical protein GY841_21625 [FCB group bacterium]|nr:hypothetical protein [FCB group bacterium]
MKIKSKPLCWMAALAVFFILSTVASAATVQLPKGTELKVNFAPGIKLSSGSLEKGATLLITLVDPLEMGGKTIVEAGARGTAIVAEVKKAGGMGKAGQIKIEFQDMETKGAYQSPEGKKITLTGFVENEGKGKGFFPYLIFVLFLKGGQGEVAADHTYTATVGETIILESK